jgi:hypothetical protein
MEFLGALEQSGLALSLKASFVIYPVVNALHVLSIGMVLTSVMLIDFCILGVFQALDRQSFIALLRRVALTGFCGALLTGFAMFSIRASEYAAMPVFLAKVSLIVLAVLNFLFFLSLREGVSSPNLLRASAALSLILWLGVLLCGRFIGFL